MRSALKIVLPYMGSKLYSLLLVAFEPFHYMSQATFSFFWNTPGEHWTIIFTETASLTPRGNWHFFVVCSVFIAGVVYADAAEYKWTIPFPCLARVSIWESILRFEGVLQVSGTITCQAWAILV